MNGIFKELHNDRVIDRQNTEGVGVGGGEAALVSTINVYITF